MKVIISKSTVKAMNEKEAALNAACGCSVESEVKKVLTFTSKAISIYENKYNYVVVFNDRILLDAYDVFIQHLPAIVQSTKTVWLLVKNMNVALNKKMEGYVKSYVNALFKAAEKEEAKNK